jgi:Xaa-Pro aminopeptidase
MNKLKSITKGSQIIDKIFWELLNMLRASHGLTELKLAYRIRKLAKDFGGNGMAFPPIVSFGKNSSEIHHSPTSQKIGKNNFLMLDYGVKVSGYCSDFTRTLFLGRPNKFHEKIYNIVLSSQKTTIKKVAPGAVSDEIDFTARHIINQTGYGKNFTHGTGHGVGKKIHEWPSFKTNTNDIVARNTVVTVEPGIYLPGKFGVRIEDMILVSASPKILSEIPKDFRSMIIK